MLCAALGMGTGGAQPNPVGEYCSVQQDQPEAHVVGVESVIEKYTKEL